MSKKMLFIYNPMAGKEQIKNKLSEIIQIFCKEGFEVTIFATRGREDATKIIEKKGERYDYIVCSGGDGTMNEVATGLMKLEKRPICGYIPAGTVNDFASSLKIPRVMKNAASLIADGDVFNCDMGSSMTDILHMLRGLVHLLKSLIRHRRSGKMHLERRLILLKL